MINKPIDALDFYAHQGQISDPGPHVDRFDELPTDLPGIIQAIQGVMLHLHWAGRYEITLNQIRKDEANLRTVKDRLAKMIELHDAPLVQPRPLSNRTIGTCRDFSLLLTAILRHRGVPARARAGFGTYFTPGRFEDHWVCEYWYVPGDRWVMVDAQLDSLQCEALGVDFDPLDMPQEKFVSGGEAWIRCQSQGADPDLFGIFDMHGQDFIKGNVIRDFLALNKVELLPWDDFKLIAKGFEEMNDSEKALIDHLAQISSGETRYFGRLQTAFIAHQAQLLPEENHEQQN